MNDDAFNYETKVWGAPEVRLSSTYIQALKLRYCLNDLEKVRGRVLDVGCGAGNMAKAIKHYRPDLEIWGADLSREAIKAALVRPEGARFVISGGDGLPFPDGYFHAVTMFDVLEHFPDPETALGEIHRVLGANRLFHLFLPLEKQPFTIYAILHRLGWKAKEEHCGHIQFYSAKDCRNQLQRAGFDFVNTRWSIHPLYSIVDVAYFTMLSIRGRPVSTSIEGYVNNHQGKPSLAQRCVGLAKNVVVAMGYYESRLLRRIPGGGGHFTAVSL